MGAAAPRPVPNPIAREKEGNCLSKGGFGEQRAARLGHPCSTFGSSEAMCNGTHKRMSGSGPPTQHDYGPLMRRLGWRGGGGGLFKPHFQPPPPFKAQTSGSPKGDWEGLGTGSGVPPHTYLKATPTTR